MSKRMLSLILAGLLLNLVCYTPVAASPTPKEDKFAAKVEAAIAKLGVGSDARVEVSLRDKTKLRGYISEANKEGFTVVAGTTGTATKIAYPQVSKVKGNNLSSGAKIAIGAGIVIYLLYVVIAIGNSDG